MAEFNACVPYSGVATTAKLDDAALTALLSLLPPPALPGASPPHPSSKAAIHTIDLLQCLQRLATSTFVVSTMVAVNGEHAISLDMV